jgi:hypothetical protein
MPFGVIEELGPACICMKGSGTTSLSLAFARTTFF